MTRAPIEIDIPDDCEIIEGPVFSSARWADDIRKRPHTGVICFHVVVRRKWEWPAWLKAQCIVQFENNSWCASNQVPELDRSGWVWKGGGAWWRLDHGLFDFTPPTCTDWRQSLRLNPNREAKP